MILVRHHDHRRGAATALQAPINARLATAVGSAVNAALVSFAVGTVALVGLALILQVRPDMAAARALPWYAWIGGLCGVIFVIAATWGVPRLGVAMTITLMVAGQLVLGWCWTTSGPSVHPASRSI
jgi:transporter family-2 protein